MPSIPRGCRIAVCLGVLAAAGCKDSSAPVVINAVGSWSGTTSQGRALSFTVTSSGVTGGSFSYQLDGTFCDVDAEVTVGGGSPAPIQNNAFTATFDLGPSLGSSFTVNGQFQSSSSATGTLRVEDSNCGGTLNTNWTASK